jgi:GDPmannose 4,6-dehydratase
MLQHDAPDDYVIATGKLHTVADVCATAYGHVGLDWHEHVVTDQHFTRPTEISAMYGNYTKAHSILGWEPTISFENLLVEMVDTALISLPSA